MDIHQSHINVNGLTSEQVAASRAAHGENSVIAAKRSWFLAALKDAFQEPMLLLLASASFIYLMHGNLAEAAFLFTAILLVFSISQFQKSRSEQALKELAKLTRPKCKVFRNGAIEEIATESIVLNDVFIADEGSTIPADATILQANDFTVNESILTGESLAVQKNTHQGHNQVYQSTLVMSGLAICKASAIGADTEVAKIGRSIEHMSDDPSPLQIQVTAFVKKMAAAGIIIFLVIWTMNIYQTHSFTDGLLNSLTLAMSILPEEIPVSFATFMALGAWRLMQLGVIVKNTRTVETLGSATVICVDKTGTLTTNEMALNEIYVHSTNMVYLKTESDKVEEVITAAMWASETIPFDHMEKSIHTAYGMVTQHDLRSEYRLVKEYPLGGSPPIMTHVLENATGSRIIAAKGAPEAIIHQSKLSPDERAHIAVTLSQLTSKGYRVLGVALAEGIDALPENQSEFIFSFKGLVAFFDPPKENIREVLQHFYQAGIKVKIITGDSLQTTQHIAEQIQLADRANATTGAQLADLPTAALDDVTKHTTIFARMFPDAKLKVIQSLKRQHEVVAMTGDGVNDGPALKAAHIGIAMGQKGSEIAKQASAIVLSDDNLGRVVDAIAMGRKIYGNLKKAIQYIISIHIPIILIVFLPFAFGWIYPTIFTPVHVIFLELIMGPTCSIIYENEPLEPNAMSQQPRTYSKTFFDLHELSMSVIQGLAIAGGLMITYWFSVGRGNNLEETATLVFLTLITANVVLTLVNRSFYFPITTTLRYPNPLIPLVIGITTLLVGTILAFEPLRHFFHFSIPKAAHIVTAVFTGFLSSFSFEGYKAYQRTKVNMN